MNFLRATLLLLLILYSSKLAAQVTINHPIDGAVYQRVGGNPGSANIAIAGSYTISPASSIQARLVIPNTSTPISGFDWTIIDASPNKGTYYGYLYGVPAGWYTLQIRVMKSGTQLQNAQLNRVGVGDVFLISGQSNASGWPSTSGVLGSNDERVRTHDAYQGCNAVIPGFPLMTQLADNSKLGITGENAWCYGKLGQDLVGQTGYPVAFFNAGGIGSSVENWENSSNGMATINPFTGLQYCNQVGSPYQDFYIKTLNYYNSLFGIRAILWHQGESDQFLGTTTSQYQSRLTNQINKTRTDFGATVPWVVSRASYYNGNTSSNVINGQNNTISSVTQVYAGPSTDDINTTNNGPGYRDDNVHLNDQGLITLSNRWKNSLNSSFFSSSNSIAHEVTPALQVAVNGANVTLTAPSGYSSYKWTNIINYLGPTLATSQSFTQTSGVYVCFMTDNNGNITFSQSIDVSAVKNRIDNNVACSSSVYLSDLKPYSQYNGFGPIEFDKSNGGNGDGDGSNLLLNGIGYSKGLGVHANSEIVYQLPPGKFFNFKSSIGIDDEVGNAGSVQFQVFNNNTLLYQSPTMTGASATLNIDINIVGVTTLKLKVIGIGGTSSAHADWANAILTCGPPDTTPPTAPTAVMNTDSLTKCSTFTWTAATDNVGVSEYYIYKDNVYQVSIPGGQTTYTLSGLTAGSSFTFGVQARDAAGNTSAITSITGNTTTLSYGYPFTNSNICINTEVLPATLNPIGGSFAYESLDTDYILNPTSGGVTITQNNAFTFFRYTIGQGTVCEDFIIAGVRGNTKPPSTSITSTDTLINQGTPAVFNSASCGSFATTWFDFSAGNSGTPKSFNLNDTTLVYAFCNNNDCFSDTSNAILVKVIPDCPQNFDLISTKDDLPGTKYPLFFKASDAVEAKNDLTLQAEATFTAGKEILLKPGFQADSGTVFSAKIEGCP